MGNLLASSVLSAPMGERVLTPFNTVAATSKATPTLQVIPAPPSLGTLPKGPKGRVLAASGLVYGGLLVAGLAMAAVVPTKAAPQRIVTVSLDAFGGAFAPPPAGSERGVQATAPASPKEEGVPVQPSVASPQVPEATGTPKAADASAQGQSGGSSGGAPGGAAGGVVGGQLGGTGEGQAGAVVAPRFDVAYLQNPEPDYPSLSKRFGEEGRVILRVLVNPEGQPEQVEVRQSSGHARLDQAALGTVRRWRFTPARRGTERLAAWVLVPLFFQLDA